MRVKKVFFPIVFLGFLLIAAIPQALAQKVLMLTSNVEGSNPEPPDTASLFNFLQQEFEEALPSSTDLTRMSVLGNPNAISRATFEPANGAYDIVIVSSVSRPIDPSNWAVLQEAVANRWANSVLFFEDYLLWEQDPENPYPEYALDLINAITTYDLKPSSAASGHTNALPLNEKSPYAKSFVGMTPLVLDLPSLTIDNLPSDNILFTAPPESNPDGNSLNDPAYAALIPPGAVNGGKGACIFVTIGALPLDPISGSNSKGKVGPAFIHAISDENGACGLPKVTQNFDKAELVLRGNENNAMLRISFSNSSPDAIPNARLRNQFPSPLLIGAGSVTSTCIGGELNAVEGSNSLSFSGFGIPAGGCSINVPASWPNANGGTLACINTPQITNTITPGIDFLTPIGQVHSASSASITCVLPSTLSAKPAAIPTSSPFTLALMFASVLMLGAFALRKVR